MRNARMKLSEISLTPVLHLWRFFAVLLAVAALSFGSVPALSAQPEQGTTAKAPANARKPAARTRKQTGVTKPSPATPAAPEPDAPLLPLWPANEHPSAANVVWNSHGLQIDAANSSLQQILKDVSAAIGATVSGLGADQRIFGTFGPGPAREVLSELLDGSGYNVLMIGDQGQGTPRQIVLSRMPSGPAAPSMANNSSQESDDSGSADAEEPPPPPQPEPQPPNQPQQQQQPNMPPGFGPGAQPRTPQQILQEMQQRQQQIEQMQQQQRTNPQ